MIYTVDSVTHPLPEQLGPGYLSAKSNQTTKKKGTQRTRNVTSKHRNDLWIFFFREPTHQETKWSSLAATES